MTHTREPVFPVNERKESPNTSRQKLPNWAADELYEANVVALKLQTTHDDSLINTIWCCQINLIQTFLNVLKKVSSYIWVNTLEFLFPTRRWVNSKESFLLLLSKQMKFDMVWSRVEQLSRCSSPGCYVIFDPDASVEADIIACSLTHNRWANTKCSAAQRVTSLVSDRRSRHVHAHVVWVVY